MNRSPDDLPTGALLDGLCLDAGRRELREDDLPVVDQVLDAARFDHGDDVVVGEQAPSRSAPYVHSPAVGDQEIGIDAPRSALHAFHCEAEVAGEENRRVAARLADPVQAGSAGKRQDAQGGLDGGSRGVSEPVFHSRFPNSRFSGFHAAISTKVR